MCGKIVRKKKRGLHEEETFIEEILIAKACGGVLLLSNLSLVSIGFSAWSIGAVTTGEAQIYVSAAGIVDVNSYINYGTATIFDYCKDGIISNDTIVTNGDVIVNFTINLNDSNDTIANHLDGATSFLLATTFTNGSEEVSAIFSTYLSSVTLSASSSQNDVDYRLSPTKREDDGSKTCKTTFQISDVLDSSHAYFKVKYSFEKMPIGDDFNKQVYAKLNHGIFWFNFKAEVETA